MGGISLTMMTPGDPEVVGRSMGGASLLAAWLDPFATALQVKRYAARTVEEYRREVAVVGVYLAGQGRTALGQVTRDDLAQYQTGLYAAPTRTGGPLSAATQAKKLAAVKTFFRWLVVAGYLAWSPAEELALPRVRRRLPRGVLTVREVEKVLAQPAVTTPLGLRDRAILELLYSSGLRNTELRTVTLADLDLARRELQVVGKGGRPRVVPVGAVAAQWLVAYVRDARPRVVRGESPVLFVSARGQMLSRRQLAWLVGRYARRAGVKTRVTPHTLRHTCATHLLRGRADLRVIQELLGHRSLSTTQIYTRVEISQLQQVHARCHPREQEPVPDAPLRLDRALSDGSETAERFG